MAIPKKDVLIIVQSDNVIEIWADNISARMAGVKNIEGVVLVHIDNSTCIHVVIDRRYDVQDITTEIDQLLSTPLPALYCAYCESEIKPADKIIDYARTVLFCSLHCKGEYLALHEEI